LAQVDHVTGGAAEYAFHTRTVAKIGLLVFAQLRPS